MRNIAPRRSGRSGVIAMIVAAFCILAIMQLLGRYLSNEFRSIQIESEARAGSLYVEGFLAEHARQFLGSRSLPDESRDALMMVLHTPAAKGKIDALKIWEPDGDLVFSSDGTLFDEDENPLDLKQAAAGEVIAELYTEVASDAHAPIAPPFIEVHAPIYDSGHQKIVAVGEIYVDAHAFLQHREQIERSIWLAIRASTLGLMALMFLAAWQRSEVLRGFERMRAIATQNKRLKNSADQARVQASRLNEDMLNQLGAELHDGPVQMLSLLALKLGKDTPGKTSADGLSSREIAESVMADLRSISTGLILPEISDLTLEQTLRLAVARHKQITGQPVAVALSGLPAKVDPALRICLYRLVQEGLANAQRHGGGVGTRVDVQDAGGSIIVTISDDGAPDGTHHPETGRGGGLGLRGLKMRLAVFGGDLELIRRQSGGAELVARVPLDAIRDIAGEK